MPTIHRQDGFRFVINTDDHPLAHVHVYHGGKVALLYIGDANRAPSVRDPQRMATHDVRRALRMVEEHQALFVTRWEELHGPQLDA
jgi:hypothetical protein